MIKENKTAAPKRFFLKNKAKNIIADIAERIHMTGKRDGLIKIMNVSEIQISAARADGVLVLCIVIRKYA